MYKSNVPKPGEAVLFRDLGGTIIWRFKLMNRRKDAALGAIMLWGRPTAAFQGGKSMEDVYSRFFAEIGLTGEELEKAARKEFRLQHVRKGTTPFHQGDLLDNYRFLASDGVFRLYYVTDSGTETTRCIVTDFAEALFSDFDLNQVLQSSDSLEALTDADILVISDESLQKLRKQFERVDLILAGMLQKAWYDNWNMRQVFQTMQGTERVKWMMQNMPRAMETVKASDVASFLNMTPVQLCRIRKKLKENV